ncbi:MAG: MBL fold metallo-hydrolase [Hydrogenophaga sp.]|nr:MBL fold metallo-hydrolase [Hydrogenophaga sp.]
MQGLLGNGMGKGQGRAGAAATSGDRRGGQLRASAARLLRVLAVGVKRLPVVALLGAVLSGCHTLGTGDPDQPHPGLLSPGLCSAGLALHHLNIASGLYVHRAEADDGLVLPRQQALAGLGIRGDSVTWLGHSSVLLRLGGMTILTDPVFAGGFSLESPLPHRHAAPPLALDDLPPIDIVVISHGDYDHLHTPSLKAIAARFPKARILLPDGLEKYGEEAGFSAVDHPVVGETVVAGRARLTALAAVHGTRRNLLAKLDGEAYSWDIRIPRRSALFVGDSAHDGAVFGEIGRSRGPYDLALVPIGAFEPSPLVADMHSTPEDAALILAELRAKLGIGIHWGTFALSPEPLRAPADRFLAASDGHRRARVLRIGETLALGH